MLTVVDTGPDIFGCITAAVRACAAGHADDDDDATDGGPNAAGDADDDDLSDAVVSGGVVVGDANDWLAPCRGPFGVIERVVLLFVALFDRGLTVRAESELNDMV